MENMQVVTFKLGDSYFGINIMKVREILRLSPITKIPTTTPYLRGIINVRGKVVPVIEIAAKLEITGDYSSDEARLLLVEKAGHTAGLLVDQVSEVLYLTPDEVEDIDDQGSQVGYSDAIVGIAKRDDALLTIIDIEGLI